jgi:hypothetical protein
MTFEEIKNESEIEVLNGQCYKRSDIYNRLIKQQTDPLNGELVDRERIAQMYRLLKPEQKLIIDDLNQIPEQTIQFLTKIIL